MKKRKRLKDDKKHILEFSSLLKLENYFISQYSKSRNEWERFTRNKFNLVFSVEFINDSIYQSIIVKYHNKKGFKDRASYGKE